MKRYVKAERIFELTPQYDARKSFYGKAKVLQRENGDNELIRQIESGEFVPH